jgi:hypothetical protein
VTTDYDVLLAGCDVLVPLYDSHGSLTSFRFYEFTRFASELTQFAARHSLLPTYLAAQDDAARVMALLAYQLARCSSDWSADVSARSLATPLCGAELEAAAGLTLSVTAASVDDDAYPGVCARIDQANACWQTVCITRWWWW